MKGKSKEELMKLVAEARGQLRAERFAAAGARPKDSSAAGKLRKKIARVLTELSTLSHAA